MSTTNPHDPTRRPLDDPDARTLPEEKPKKLDLSLTQLLGGALAAMTAAALGSRLGVAGTITGAAVASIVAGVGGSLYTASLRTTREKVKTVWTGRVAGTDTKTAVDVVPDAPVWDAPDAAVSEPRPSVLTPRRLAVPWKAMTVAVLTVFVIAAAALTTFEALSGSALSGGKGTTISHLGKEQAKKAKPAKKATASDSASPSPSDADSPSSEPSATEEPSGQAPSDAPPSTRAAPQDEPSATEAAPSAPGDNTTTGSGTGDSSSGSGAGDNKAGSSPVPTPSASASSESTPAG
jgi:hypothetical protein